MTGKKLFFVPVEVQERCDCSKIVSWHAPWCPICNTCKGVGRVIEGPVFVTCGTCHGNGVKEGVKAKKVKVFVNGKEVKFALGTEYKTQP